MTHLFFFGPSFVTQKRTGGGGVWGVGWGAVIRPLRLEKLAASRVYY